MVSEVVDPAVDAVVARARFAQRILRETLAADKRRPLEIGRRPGPQLRLRLRGAGPEEFRPDEAPRPLGRKARREAQAWTEFGNSDEYPIDPDPAVAHAARFDLWTPFNQGGTIDPAVVGAGAGAGPSDVKILKNSCID